jgi:hypothetical protein
VGFRELPAGLANNSVWAEDSPASVAKGTISRSQCLKPAHPILGLMNLKRQVACLTASCQAIKAGHVALALLANFSTRIKFRCRSDTK